MKVHEIKTERSKVVTQMKSLNDSIKSRGKDSPITKDEQIQWDRMAAEIVAYDGQIQRQEFIDRQDKAAALRQIAQGDAALKDLSKEERVSEVNKAMATYLKRGINGTNSEERALLAATGLIQEDAIQARTQSSVTANLGAEFVREEYLNEFERHMLAHSGMMEAGRIIQTATGANIPYPTIDDTSNEGAILGQGVADTIVDIPTDFKNIGSFKYTSKGIKVPVELIQDDGFGLVNEIPSLAAERVARIANKHLTYGTGSGQPEGVITAATASGVTHTAGSVSRAKILQLIHSVNAAYRRNGSKLMFSDDTLMQIISLSIGSSDDRPLWVPSMVDSQPSKIEGYEYVINYNMPSNDTAGNKYMAFGDFSKYIIRIVQDFQIKRSEERHIEEFVVGFYGFCRMDGKLINTDAIKTLAAA